MKEEQEAAVPRHSTSFGHGQINGPMLWIQSSLVLCSVQQHTGYGDDNEANPDLVRTMSGNDACEICSWSINSMWHSEGRWWHAGVKWGEAFSDTLFLDCTFKAPPLTVNSFTVYHFSLPREKLPYWRVCEWCSLNWHIIRWCSQGQDCHSCCIAANISY